MKSAGYIYIRNWDEFQHYKDRNPPWIKNYTTLLRDDDYYELSFHDRGVLHGLWILAASCGNGRVSASKAFLRSQLGQSRINLDTLLDLGWITIEPEKAASPRREWASRYIPDDVRKELYASAGHECQDCGAKRNLEVDHVLPVSRGGTSDVENLRVLCRSCNRRKQAKTPEEYKTWMESTEHLRSNSPQSVTPEREKRQRKRENGASSRAASASPNFSEGKEQAHHEETPLTRQERREEARTALTHITTRSLKALP